MGKREDNLPSLLISITLDLVGCLTYIVPFAEYADILWAPISAWFFFKLYGGRIGKFGAAISFVEEVLPFVDFIPTFTIAWFVRKFELRNRKQIEE